MTLTSILKTIGKDLSHVGGWIDNGLKIVEPVVVALDPPLVPIFSTIESVLGSLPANSPITPDFLEKLVTAIVTIEAVRSAGSKAL